MRKWIIKYIGAFLLFIIAGGIFTANSVQAASAEVEISADSTEVTVGQDFFVYIRINSDSFFGDFEANLTYDDDILEYMEGASVITGSSGYLKISDFSINEGTQSRKYTLKFRALKAGVTEISFPRNIMIYEYETGDEMSVSSYDLTIEVKPEETASENAFLKSLKISPSLLTPEFDKNVFEYSTQVDAEIEKLVINALPEDEKATIKISGNDSLKEGENKIIITVLAESGTIIEYTINAFREANPNPEETEDPILTPGTTQSLFEVVRLDGEIYAIYNGKYKLVEPDKDVEIPKGYVKTKAILSDISINAYYPENDLENEFFLIYAENAFGDRGFYQYDRIEKTMQRFVTKDSKGTNNVIIPETEESMQVENYRANLTKAAIVIAALSIICALLIIVLIRFYMKQKGYKTDDLD